MTHNVHCKLKQGVNKIKFTENIEGIDEWKHSWPDGEISYRLNNFTTDIKKERNQKRAVTISLRAWQLHISNLKFRRERNPDVTVDFNVSFKPLEEFSSEHVLAHAWFPGQGDISGDVEINDSSWDWVTSAKFSSMGKPPLVPILIHEFGHSLGLRHDTTTMQSIMYPSFNIGAKKNDLHPRDVSRIQERYGVRRLSQRILDYFRLRRDRAWDFR